MNITSKHEEVDKRQSIVDWILIRNFVFIPSWIWLCWELYMTLIRR